MCNQREFDELWFSFQTIPGARFKLNDSVRIVSGEHAGEFASVISLISLKSTPTYLVELGSSGSDVQIAEPGLEPIG